MTSHPHHIALSPHPAGSSRQLGRKETASVHSASPGAGCLINNYAPRQLRVLDLFSGIGGFSLGLERTGGFETVAFCEIEEFPRKVLRKHWPEVPIYEDVRDLTASVLERDGICVDVITGGFPCQDISVAGKQAGIGEGTRSGLWSEIARLVGELRPRYVIVENVANLLRGPSEQPGGWFGRVLGDLAELGYDAEWENIPAAAVGAPHRRERIWVVAYDMQNGRRDGCFPVGFIGKSHCGGSEGLGGGYDPIAEPHRARGAGRKPGFHAWRHQPNVGRVVHGVPYVLDRLGGLGNAVVPQIPELIGNAILEFHHAPRQQEAAQ